MFGSKIDLFDKEWLDVVFAKKNKSYGAYELRKDNGTNTTKALFLASAVFIFLFPTPVCRPPPPHGCPMHHVRPARSGSAADRIAGWLLKAP